MQGYYVLTSDPETHTGDDETLLSMLRKSTGMVNAQTTRTLNAMTGGIFKKQVSSARARLRNSTPEKKAKRREESKKEEIREAKRKYNARKDVKERNREARKRRSALMSLIPPEIITKYWKQYEQNKEEESKAKDEVVDEDLEEADVLSGETN